MLMVEFHWTAFVTKATCILPYSLRDVQMQQTNTISSPCRFQEHWRFVLQRLAFLATFVGYLECEALVTREEAAKIIGSKCYLKKYKCLSASKK
jgi:hypothetical protein